MLTNAIIKVESTGGHSFGRHTWSKSDLMEPWGKCTQKNRSHTHTLAHADRDTYQRKARAGPALAEAPGQTESQRQHQGDMDLFLHRFGGVSAEVLVHVARVLAPENRPAEDGLAVAYSGSLLPPPPPLR